MRNEENANLEGEDSYQAGWEQPQFVKHILNLHADTPDKRVGLIVEARCRHEKEM